MNEEQRRSLALLLVDEIDTVDGSANPVLT
jgi:hypothetical protein